MTKPEIATGGRADPLSTIAPRIVYVRLTSREMSGKALFAVTFGGEARPASPGAVHVNLEPQAGSGLTELWLADGPVSTGTSGAIHHSSDDHHLAGVIEVDEHDHGDIVAATDFAYRAIVEFQASSHFPHLLRTWNYLDSINVGNGNGDRYRGFCSGRVSGLDGWAHTQHPAATVIGRRDGRRVLQVYWLAGRLPGLALENPLQLSATQNQRQCGRTSPIFSRATLVAPELLLISGTASLVGHASRHEGSIAGQVGENLANLESLLFRAHTFSPALPSRLGRGTLIKAYVRNRGDAQIVVDHLRAHVPAEVPFLVLLGDVCRADLLVEFDCLHAAG